MEYGKFASVDELMKGYNELEKSFTQKCQQLAEMEKEKQSLSAQLATKDDLGTNGQPSPSSDGSDDGDIARSTTVDSADPVPQDAADDAPSAPVGPAQNPTNPTEAQLQQYLLDNPDVVQKLLQNAQTEFAPAVMCGGGNVPLAPPSRPKTIKEASLMAKDLFKN